MFAFQQGACDSLRFQKYLFHIIMGLCNTQLASARVCVWMRFKFLFCFIPRVEHMRVIWKRGLIFNYLKCARMCSCDASENEKYISSVCCWVFFGIRNVNFNGKIKRCVSTRQSVTADLIMDEPHFEWNKTKELRATNYSSLDDASWRIF